MLDAWVAALRFNMSMHDVSMTSHDTTFGVVWLQPASELRVAKPAILARAALLGDGHFDWDNNQEVWSILSGHGVGRCKALFVQYLLTYSKIRSPLYRQGRRSL